MEPNERTVVILAAKAHRARTRLEMILDLGCALAKHDDSSRREYLIGLINQAYGDDPQRRGELIEAVTQKG